jgi:hypothetical protein
MRQDLCAHVCPGGGGAAHLRRSRAVHRQTEMRRLQLTPLCSPPARKWHLPGRQSYESGQISTAHSKNIPARSQSAVVRRVQSLGGAGPPRRNECWARNGAARTRFAGGTQPAWELMRIGEQFSLQTATDTSSEGLPLQRAAAARALLGAARTDPPGRARMRWTRICKRPPRSGCSGDPAEGARRQGAGTQRTRACSA